MPFTIPNGLYGVTLTPFFDDGAFDEQAFRTELEFCLGTGVTGLVTCGSTSEFIYLDTAQAMCVASIAAEVVGKRKILVGGACAPTERAVIGMIERLAELGFRYALVSPPFYYPQRAEDVLSFYREINKHMPSGMGLILYHIPFCTTGIDLSILPRLMELETVVGMKDSSGDMLYHVRALRILQKVKPDAALFTGQDVSLLPSLAIGGRGCMSAGALFLSELEKPLIEAYAAGRILDAQKLHELLAGIICKLDAVAFPENYRLLAEARQVYAGKAQRRFLSLDKQYKDSLIKEVAELLELSFKSVP